VSTRFALQTIASTALLMCLPVFSQAQDLDGFELPSLQSTCFGMTGITETRALDICDALTLGENVRARELAQQWIQAEPQSAGAQFALAEILIQVEGNLARALFHLGRAEELTNYQTLGRALAAGNAEWHYLALSQLSYVNQLMGNQQAALDYLDKISQVYGQDVESFRGWPLIKMQEWELARESSNKVLATSNDQRERSRAWNTLCAVELAQLRPAESLEACDNSLSEDEAAADSDANTIYLLNASEVALSMLRMNEAESFLHRATRYINPQSVGDPWINLLYLYMSQGRFHEARDALGNLLVWRDSQDPVVNVMNRADHYLVSASFLLLAGYSEDAASLSATALNQPDRTGSYSADEAQKDSIAALINALANRNSSELAIEEAAHLPFTQMLPVLAKAAVFRVKAWRSARHAAALFADAQTLKSRLRPYAPLDVHIPEWMEPEIVAILGPGVVSEVLEQAKLEGAFVLNEGYYFSYKAEIAALGGNPRNTIEYADQALRLLPEQEISLKARLAAHIANAAWRLDKTEIALAHFQMALIWDPSVLRRLGLSIPVSIQAGNDEYTRELSDYLLSSPRFKQDERGLIIEIGSATESQICLRTRTGDALSCVQAPSFDATMALSPTQLLAQAFHTQTFGPGFEISMTLRMALRGNNAVIGSPNKQNVPSPRDSFLTR
jgi:tetratricopeptide (TPR) repeat protein